MSSIFRHIVYSTKHRYVRATVAYRTFMFDREIKAAYGKGYSLPELPHIPARQLKLVALTISASIVVFTAINILPKINFTSKSKKTTVTKEITSPKTIIKKAKSISLTKEIESPKAPAKQSENFIYSIAADKTKKELYLIKYFDNAQFKIFKSYSIAIGEKWGRKKSRGDLKTPEGFYWFVDKLEDDQLPPIYGVKAFVTNYPNETDVKENRTGAGIWLHGHGEEVNDKPFTRGCLRLVNDDIQDISAYLDIGTPLLICEEIISLKDSVKKYFDWSNLMEEKEKIINKYQKTQYFVEEFVNKWKTAWMNADIENFSTYYSEKDFKYKNMSFSEWKKYKEAIFKNANTIKVEVSNIKLMKWINGDAIVAFDQHYVSGTYESRNKKMLTLRKIEGKWQIANEYSLSPTN